MKNKIGKILIVLMLLVIGRNGYGITFTEDFSNNNKIDTTNTNVVVNTNLKRITLTNTQELVFEDISNQVVGFSTDTVQAVGYNGSYWLIGGTNGKLNKFDGTTFTDLTSSISFGTGAAGITGIDWNGSYWIIGGSRAGFGMGLFRYDGTTFTDVKDAAVTAGFNTTIRTIKANGTDVLMGGDGPQLCKYNGTTWTPLQGSLINFTGMDVASLGYNGSYWLIGGSSAGGRLNRYDGISTWVDLIGWSGNALGIGWNGTYWLVCGGGFQTSPAMSRYNGTTFTDLTSSFVGFSSHVGSATWNSDYSYWLLGGGGGALAINRYDGTTFTNIASSLINYNSGTVVESIWAGNIWLIYGDGSTRSLNKGFHLYTSNNVLQSQKLNDISENIGSATLTSSGTLNGGSVSYELSADGGSHWESVIVGTSHTFKYPGKDLRYKITITASSDRKATPLLTQVSIAYKTEAKKINAGEKGEVISDDDAETKMSIPENSISKTLVYSIERIISSSKVEGVEVVKSYNFEANEPDTNKTVQNLEGVVEIIIHYTSPDGVKIYNSDGKEIAKLSEAKQKLGIGFYNGRYWVPITSEVVVNNNDVYVKSRVSHLSEYGIIRKISASIDVNVSPNPFTPKASQFNIVNFTFQNTDNESIELRIWDITGRLVRTITGNGTSAISWDGKDENGEYVEGGVYIYQLKVGNSRVKKGTIVVAY